jgi:hypothetical protein
MANEICPECDQKQNLFQSQRGLLLVYGMTLLCLLMIVDAIYAQMNTIALTAFVAFVGAGGVYYFKAKGEEAAIDSMKKT